MDICFAPDGVLTGEIRSARVRRLSPDRVVAPAPQPSNAAANVNDTAAGEDKLFSQTEDVVISASALGSHVGVGVSRCF
jgi:hypothetical protein